MAETTPLTEAEAGIQTELDDSHPLPTPDKPVTIRPLPRTPSAPSSTELQELTKLRDKLQSATAEAHATEQALAKASLAEFQEDIPEGYCKVYISVYDTELPKISRDGLNRQRNKRETGSSAEIEKIFNAAAQEQGVPIDRTDCIFAYPHDPRLSPSQLSHDAKTRTVLEIAIDPQTARVCSLDTYSQASLELSSNPRLAKEYAQQYWQDSQSLAKYLENPTEDSDLEVLIPTDIPRALIRLARSPEPASEPSRFPGAEILDQGEELPKVALLSTEEVATIHSEGKRVSEAVVLRSPDQSCIGFVPLNHLDPTERGNLDTDSLIDDLNQALQQRGYSKFTAEVGHIKDDDIEPLTIYSESLPDYTGKHFYEYSLEG